MVKAVARNRYSKDIIQLLIQGGADPNKASRNGQTPLHWAAAEGHKDVIPILLKGGANPNKTDSTGRAPLYYARKYGRSQPDAVKFLLNGGANPI